DCVAMSVNDIICCGAKPLFFLDYIACGKNIPERIEAIVAGVAEGCVQSGCALIGGETAEMPGFYPVDEYDIAGFAVGVVDKLKILNKNEITAGDIVIALPSSGVHSNGFSLVRKVFSEEELRGELGARLLTPTKIYVKPVLALLDKVRVKSISHITGGGFYENIPRSLPSGIGVKIEKAAIKTPEIFDIIASRGSIPVRDMFNTFNMGVGMSLTVAKNDADKALEILRQNGEEAYILGETTNSGEIEIC
ncbi:MAG: phosphoribosylformylglycinamidine cyclo-ligase, partial [Papillibacter sp.]|nr:phosphoribosylformylglycinamidine cyclo-ligase [Papillibacter sp.]